MNVDIAVANQEYGIFHRHQYPELFHYVTYSSLAVIDSAAKGTVTV